MLLSFTSVVTWLISRQISPSGAFDDFGSNLCAGFEQQLMGSFLLLRRPFSRAFRPDLNLEYFPFFEIQVSRAPKPVAFIDPIGLRVVRDAELIEFGETQASVLAAWFCESSFDKTPRWGVVRFFLGRNYIALQGLPSGSNITLGQLVPKTGKGKVERK